MKKYLTILIAVVACLSSYGKGRITAHRGDVPNSYNFWLYEPASVVSGEPTNPNTILSSNNNDTEKRKPVGTFNDILERNETEEYVPDDELPAEDGEVIHVEDEDEQGKPVVIFLHGASLCGNDLNRVRRYGTIHAIESGRDMDAYVIAPQNPGGSWNPQKIMQIVDWLSNRRDIDKDRIYVLGMSLGGYGAIDMAAAYPDKIAAAIGMCGGATRKDLSGLAEVPLWIIHGTADRAVAVTESDKVVKAIKQADPWSPRLIYDRVAGMNHSQPARMFYKPETYEWLFSHSLSEDGRPVTEGFDVSPSALTNVYKGLNIKKTSSTTTKKKATKRITKKSTAKKSTTKKSTARKK